MKDDDDDGGSDEREIREMRELEVTELVTLSRSDVYMSCGVTFGSKSDPRLSDGSITFSISSA